jgi:hypothetical protein
MPAPRANFGDQRLRDLSERGTGPPTGMTVSSPGVPEGYENLVPGWGKALRSRAVVLVDESAEHIPTPD